MIKKIILSLVIFLIFFSIFLILAYRHGINTPASTEQKEVVFIIEKGETVNEIADSLHKAGLINSEHYFKYFLWLQNLESNLNAGTYILNTNQNIKEVVKMLVRGKTVEQERQITIIEGWTIDDIDNYLTAENIIKKGEFIKAAQNKELILQLNINYPDLFPVNAESLKNLEGYLFPDTYRIYANAAPNDIINKMVANLNSKITPEMLNTIKNEGRPIYEVLTMASVVEKEVQTSQDMKVVSGIFLDRIKNGQPLQSDATLTYFLQDGKPSHSSADLEIDSLYNTYKYKGLPPGPICNPGLNAINAAIYPINTAYNYFLNRSDTGETVFSKTYAEHLKNQAKYIK